MTRAGKLVAALRRIASTLPRTNGIGFYVSIAFGCVQLGAVNTRTSDLIAAVRRIASTLPGAIGIGFYALHTCDLVQITAATDADVPTLGRTLGLGASTIRVGEGFAKGRWWVHATGQQPHGDVWIVLAGPHHKGTPPTRALPRGLATSNAAG